MMMRIHGRRERKKTILWIVLANVPACRVGRKGGWEVAQSPIPGTTITLECLHRRGYEFLPSQSLKDHFNDKDFLFPSV